MSRQPVESEDTACKKPSSSSSSPENQIDDKEELLQWAAGEQLQVMVPAPGVLFLDWDFDTRPELSAIKEELAFFGVGVDAHAITRSRSGNHHIYLRLKPPTVLSQRIALALSLPGDQMAVRHSLRRMLAGIQHPVRAFELPREAETLKSFKFARELK